MHLDSVTNNLTDDQIRGLYALWLKYNKPRGRAFIALAYMNGFPDMDYSYLVQYFIKDKLIHRLSILTE